MLVKLAERRTKEHRNYDLRKRGRVEASRITSILLFVLAYNRS
jgi:hypothetical protein